MYGVYYENTFEKNHKKKYNKFFNPQTFKIPYVFGYIYLFVLFIFLILNFISE